MLVFHYVHKQRKLFLYLEKSIDSALLLSLYLCQTTFCHSISDSCSMENLNSPGLLYYDVHQVWEKQRCSPSSNNHCRSPSACGDQQRWHAGPLPASALLCYWYKENYHRLRFSNRCVEESENIGRKQQITRLMALNNLFALQWLPEESPTCVSNLFHFFTV